mgnify:CR=1 FL=1
MQHISVRNRAINVDNELWVFSDTGCDVEEMVV